MEGWDMSLGMEVFGSGDEESASDKEGTDAGSLEI